MYVARHTDDVLLLDLADAIERSAAPEASRLSVGRLLAVHPEASTRLHDPHLAAAVVTATAASRELSRVIENDPVALDVLAHLDERPVIDASSAAALVRSKQREYLRIATRDLLRLDDLPTTVAAISALATDVLGGAVALTAPSSDLCLAVIGMGKLGGEELNYASDIDVMFVGEGDAAVVERWARRVMEVARRCFRVDANLRPQGRDGSLARTLASYEAYWTRWAEPWEFQALLKARSVAGDPDLGALFDASAGHRLWDRLFSADDLRSLRHMKARAEAELARKGLTDREVKRGRGGLRDIEFAVQLLQLVHGRLDHDVRSPTTLTALAELAASGYVDSDDAGRLADAYRFLRRVEHVLQLHDGAQVYAMPADEPSRTRVARTLGYRDAAAGSAVEQLDAELSHHQVTVRTIHERLYFRPLLEAFASADGELLAKPGAVEARLSAFGFSDGERMRDAVSDLTRGLSRLSHLMQQMLPLMLGWLAETPDPDLGLFRLRSLVGDRGRAEELARSFRESPEAARRLCALIGTSRVTADIIQRNLDLVARLPANDLLRTQPKADLVEKAGRALSWREGATRQQAALLRWKARNLLGVMARDILGSADVATVGHDITVVAEAALEVALQAVEPTVPFAVIAMGRFGGAELSYGSDLDLVFAFEGAEPDDHAEGLRVASALRRFMQGATPATRLWDMDVDLRPEGKQGLLARSVEGYRRYFADWALVWERQAMLRARPVAGDEAVAAAFMGVLDEHVWGRGLSADDTREIRRLKARIERERIPAGEDPQFHLKLGRGSLSDIEWTVQLLQMRHGIRATGTMEALDRLLGAGVLAASDHAVLVEAYGFCELTRNRLYLVRGAPGDSLPQQVELLRLARALETTPTELRQQYRRVTRRARTAMERLFYGRDDGMTTT
jgi:[glutamine synthetase] adenylyltransferase / [glutamine synthetase]-adenylyl-L-tyrosine phosphorylase